MSDKNKKKPSDEQLDLETSEKTAQIEQEIDENKEKIKNYKKQAARSFVLAFSTLIAIIAICIAWFVSNTTVTMTGTSISAEDSVPFELGSAGVRQEWEENKLSGILSAGTQKNYGKYIDVDYAAKKGTAKDGTITLQTGSGGLAWYLGEQESVFPGESGTMEFYIIPRQDGLREVKINLSLEGYEDGIPNAQKKENAILQELIKGHILIFEKVDDNIGYSGWLPPDEPLTIKAADLELGRETFEKNVPYKITFQWVWPKYFRNYVYAQRSTEGDLFTEATPTGSKTDYQALLDFINKQREIAIAPSAENNKLFYSEDMSILRNDKNMKNTISRSMEDATVKSCDLYYNLADEYIGNNATYIYVKVAIE